MYDKNFYEIYDLTILRKFLQIIFLLILILSLFNCKSELAQNPLTPGILGNSITFTPDITISNTDTGVSPVEYTFTNTVTYTLTSIDPEASIKYTLDGTDPSAIPPGNGIDYVSPITFTRTSVDQSITIRAVTYKLINGIINQSNVNAITVIINARCITPSVTEPQNPGQTNQAKGAPLVISSANSDTIYYTRRTDGGEPSAPTDTPPASPLPTETHGSVSPGGTIYLPDTSGLTVNYKFIAYGANREPSIITQKIYNTFPQTTQPSFNVSSGTYNNDISLTMTTDANAYIYYTRDTSTPDVDITNGNPVGAGTIKSPSTGSVTITISSNANGSAGTTVKAIAFSTTGGKSTLTTATYILKCAKPAVNFTPGTYNNDFTNTLSTGTTGANLKYTLNTSDPNGGTSAGTSINITMNGNVSSTYTRIRAIAAKSGYLSSDEFSGDYVFKCAQPVLSVNKSQISTYNSSPLYENDIIITVTCSTSGARLRYTESFDGASFIQPTDAGNIYSVPINYKRATAFAVIAFKNNYLASDYLDSSRHKFYLHAYLPSNTGESGHLWADDATSYFDPTQVHCRSVVNGYGKREYGVFSFNSSQVSIGAKIFQVRIFSKVSAIWETPPSKVNYHISRNTVTNCFGSNSSPNFPDDKVSLDTALGTTSSLFVSLPINAGIGSTYVSNTITTSDLYNRSTRIQYVVSGGTWTDHYTFDPNGSNLEVIY